MDITGIICEYNPLHLGHKKQLSLLKSQFPDRGIVCLMSGNFVQRGKPAIIDKSLRAKAAILSGADLVLELPLTACLSSAEGFAAEGVRILGSFCNYLCFGAETADKDLLMSIAGALLDPAFPDLLAKALETGVSFPVARQIALERMGVDASALNQPNNILAAEYCKAILSQKSSMTPLPILREGSYHDTQADPQNPSATAVRACMVIGSDWESFVPATAYDCFKAAPLHSIKAGERAILAKLRTMSDEDFEALPYGSEGLWRKLMHASRKEATLENIIAAVKSKRYTRSRLDRMVMCAFLGLTEKDLQQSAPYARVLALNDKGRQILKTARQFGTFPNIGEKTGDPYEELEIRSGRLYGLFCNDQPETPDLEADYRICYVQ